VKKDIVLLIKKRKKRYF